MPNSLPKSMLDKVKTGTDQELAEMFAPVVYFAGDEKWLPADMKSFYSIAGLREVGSAREPVLSKEHFREDRIPDDLKNNYKSILAKKVPFSALGTNEDKEFVLRFLKHGHDYYLNVPDFDVEAMTVQSGPAAGAHGGRNLVNAAVRQLGNNKPGYKGCCYAKVRKLGRAIRFSPKTTKGRLYNGYWTIIHYFFFYAFNFSTNIHEGDWDSSITVCVNTNNGHVFVTYNQHHTTWFTELNLDRSFTRDNWLQTWTDGYDANTNSWRKREPGFAFGMGLDLTHPVGIVAGGSHGVYPTPGTIIFGISIPFSKDLPFTVDDRKLDLGVGPKGLVKTAAGFPNTKFRWDNIMPIQDDIDDDPPKSAFAFKGHWGEVSPTRAGWDGPKSPLFSSIWSHCDRTGHFERLLTNDDNGYKSRYSRGGQMLANVMLNTHRV